MKAFRFKFGITTVIMVINRGITFYLTRKIIKKYKDLVFRVFPCVGFREARLLLGKGYEMRILQHCSDTELHDVAITHDGVLDLNNGIIDSMRLSISSAEVERLMDKAQRKEW